MPTDQTWISEQRFNRLVVLGVLVGFAAVVLAGIGALLTIRENQRQTAWVDHTYQVERRISHFRVLLERTEAARRGTLLIPDASLILDTFRQSRAALPPAMDAIEAATRDNPRQQATIARLRPALAQELSLLDQSAELVRTGRAERAIDLFRQSRDAHLVGTLRAAADAMLAEEDRLLRVRNAAQVASAWLFGLIAAVAGLLLLATGAASVWIIHLYTRDLNRSRLALRGANETLEDAVRERTTDLRRANEEIQRFAYIVSHDLRSPLVNVMGFTAELEQATKALTRLVDRVEEVVPDELDSQARDAARVDLPEAIGFIRTSTQKMDRLINAILRLSREGRRAITPEPLDMDALAQAVADTLRHRSDELGARIEIAPRLPRIVSDRVAVEQILSNIVENALKYLKRDVPGHIRVAGHIEHGRALFTVADNGRGIDPRDHDRIFDLFRRSGVQDQPGEGIGLAHTRALAYRLGGSITVESALGEGATFRINLPVRYSGEQGALA